MILNYDEILILLFLYESLRPSLEHAQQSLYSNGGAVTAKPLSFWRLLYFGSILFKFLTRILILYSNYSICIAYVSVRCCVLCYALVPFNFSYCFFICRYFHFWNRCETVIIQKICNQNRKSRTIHQWILTSSFLYKRNP